MGTQEIDVLTIAEIANRLGMGVRQTYRYARSGDLLFGSVPGSLPQKRHLNGG